MICRRWLKPWALRGEDDDICETSLFEIPGSAEGDLCLRVVTRDVEHDGGVGDWEPELEAERLSWASFHSLFNDFLHVFLHLLGLLGSNGGYFHVFSLGPTLDA